MRKAGFFRSVQIKFIIIFILLLLIAFQVIGSYFVRKLETELVDSFKNSVSDRVEVVNYYLEQAFDKERNEDDELTLQQEVQNIISEVDTNEITNLQVINKQNRVIGTNNYLEQETIGKKTTEDIVQHVLRLGNERDTVRLKAETGNRVYVKATPILDDDGAVEGAVYLEASLEGVYSQLQCINDIFLKGAILAISISALIGIMVARTFTKPIMEMRSQAQTMAMGNFSQKVSVYGTDEIGQLAETFNYLNDRLRHAMATTEEERRKLESVLSNMSDGVIATDDSGVITLINKAAAKLIGKDPTRVEGEFLPDVLRLDEQNIDLSALHDQGSVVIDYSDRNELFVIRANFSTIVDEHGDITGFITVISDVTEQEKIERERREFVSNVSHELRTPLTTLKSYMEALIDGAWRDKTIAPRFLGVAQKETERMIRMVNDLLQLSKMDNKDYTLHTEKFDFMSYFHEVIDRFEMNKEKSIRLKRDLARGPLFVQFDKDKMTQVMDNIISNAIKYSPEGGVIHFKARRQNNQLCIAIKDEGPGIPYKKIDKIFERLYRADKARSRKLGGTGLGLAISKELVEAHGGHIWADSVEGKGTTIFFTLPLAKRKRRKNR